MASSTNSSAVNVKASSCFRVFAKAQNLHFTRQTFVWYRLMFWTKKTSSPPPRWRRARSASSPSASRSSVFINATPSSNSSRSAASTFSRIGASVSSVSRTAMRRLPFPIDHCVSQGLELVAVQFAVETRPGAPSVVEVHLASLLESAGCGDAHEGAVQGAPGECVPDDRITLRGKEERQGRRPVAEVGAGDLAGLDRGARAVEDVVGDLEGDPEREPVLAGAPAEAARRLEQLPRLERAAFEVRLDRGRRVTRLRPLQRLAACEAERRVGEDLDGGCVARRAQLGEGAREEVVAGRAGCGWAVHRPRGRLATAEVGAVDQVVVDERRHVHELDGDPRRERRRPSRRRGEEDERRTQPFTAGPERLVAHRRHEAGMGRDGACQPFLERVEVVVEPRHRTDVLEACGHAAPASPPWRATIPPAKSRNSTPSKPQRPSRSARSSGPGKRRTLAGRYVYAAPPGRRRPSSGTTRSNQSL